MTLTIRPFTYTTSDYRLALDINAAVFNEPPDSMAEWQHDDQVWDKTYPYYRDMVMRDGQVIAYVETYQSQFAYHPQKYTCRIFVAPNMMPPMCVRWYGAIFNKDWRVKTSSPLNLAC